MKAKDIKIGEQYAWDRGKWSPARKVTVLKSPVRKLETRSFLRDGKWVQEPIEVGAKNYALVRDALKDITYRIPLQQITMAWAEHLDRAEQEAHRAKEIEEMKRLRRERCERVSEMLPDDLWISITTDGNARLVGHGRDAVLDWLEEMLL